MQIDFVPRLEVMRELYARPRGAERFRTYLRTLVNDAGDDVECAPLVALNPMARAVIR